MAVLPAWVPALLNTLSISVETAPKLFDELLNAVLNAFVLVLTAPVRSLMPFFDCLSSLTAFFALPLTLESRLLELSSRFCALNVSELNVVNADDVSVSVFAKSPMLLLKLVSVACDSGLSSSSASCEAMLSAVLVNVSENISLICAATVSAPWPVIFGASAFFFSLL